ncbi:Uncharacterised protein [Enterobacter cloacae]|nr:Uncharacterised protein [Enterobacter cloacae]
MIAEEDLVLVVKGGVVGTHFATWIIGLFLLDIAGGIEVVVITTVG